MRDAANNPGLVTDCEALLAARDTLAGTATLNWSADTPISDWEGVTVEGPPQRVMELDLTDKQLSGSIPSALGNLSSLECAVPRFQPVERIDSSRTWQPCQPH